MPTSRSPLLEGWGRQVRAARQGRGWTVRVLAARAGISPPTVLRIETDRPVRAPKIAAVLTVLDLTPEP